MWKLALSRPLPGMLQTWTTVILSMSVTFGSASFSREAIATPLVPPITPPRFRDTPEHWAGDCIDRLANLKQVRGYPEGDFRPNTKVTRAEFAVLIRDRFPRIPERQIFDGPGASGPIINPADRFRDVPSNHWAYEAIKLAYQNRTFVGYPDQTFRPNQPIARVEALAILAKIVPTGEQTNGEEQPLPVPENLDQVLQEMLADAAQTPPWSKQAIATAATSFLIVDAPQGRRLRPSDATTRAEAAAFLCQAQRLNGLVPSETVVGSQYFTDSPELKKLQRATTDRQPAWFDRQRQLTIIPTAPPGFTIAYVGEFLNQTSDRVLTWFNPTGSSPETSPLAGYLDADGKLAIAPQFRSASSFSEGLAEVSQDGKHGFIDRTGTLVIPATFDETRSFREGLAAVRMDQQWGFIDKTGAWAVPLQPHLVASFSDGLARIERPGSTPWERTYGFIDRTGKIVIEPKFNAAASFSEGLSAVSIYKTETGEFIPRYGYIDKTGQWVIQGLTGPGGSFSEGLAAVTRSTNPGEISTGTGRGRGSIDGYGYIDRTNKWVLPPQGFSSPETEYFSAQSRFTQGLAIVRIGTKMGVINQQGKFVLPPRYADIESISHGYAYANYGGATVSYIGGYDASATPVASTELRGGRWGYIKLLKEPLSQQPLSQQPLSQPQQPLSQLR
jgi:hypothetical protein